MYNVAFTGMVIVAIFNLVDLDQTSQNVLQAVGVLWGSFFCSFAFVLPRLLESRRDRRALNGRGDSSYPDSSANVSDMTNRGMLKDIDESYGDNTSPVPQPQQQLVGLDGHTLSKDPSLSPHQHQSDRSTSNNDNKITITTSFPPPHEQSSSVTPSSIYRAKVNDTFTSIIYPASIWEIPDDNDEAEVVGNKKCTETHVLDGNDAEFNEGEKGLLSL
jgi:hypothetical protein